MHVLVGTAYGVPTDESKPLYKYVTAERIDVLQNAV
jgi:hypothetical protein